ncbi:NAD(P)/FAD-dependent oxidoreductase [Pelagovum pacificum]|uniref:Thioredoxin reductase n=1 Tax=Pelagovum pacificum TaxID=2588711 RepID=A0A5C5GKI7_9RHOB|nr:NAD(P)/FAD-dependent oxidoreductase [Pelagovum pacificum]QQA42889.1 NAD(P)/FAD-dependent oxidoreductase [Pelagovum pacificum]TNY33966.1 NAD(P)/FAD-dependent oxidoreductase [Pelagovum pacificum]
MTHDVIVIGGSYAGMAAALQLLRARRSVLVIDFGTRRNRFASQSHGFLGMDGMAPGDIVRIAREQLEAYKTLTWIDDTVADVSGETDAFTVTTCAGECHDGRRVIFGTGVTDALPEIEGLAERWGKHVFHCPYCHGYELNEGRIGVIGTGPNSVHQALLLPEWGPTTFLTNGVVPLDHDVRADLLRRGVTIEDTPITRLSGDATVELTDGTSLDFAGLFTASVVAPSSDVAERLGCQIEDTMLGRMISTDASKETSVPGAFACGDTARVPHSVALAVGDGSWAGASVHRSLIS